MCCDCSASLIAKDTAVDIRLSRESLSAIFSSPGDPRRKYAASRLLCFEYHCLRPGPQTQPDTLRFNINRTFEIYKSQSYDTCDL